MKILIDFQHPADVHIFRNAVAHLRRKGHSVKITGRDKDILAKLAEEYELEVEIFGRARAGLFHLGCELLYRWWRLLGIVRDYKPDRILAVAGTCVSLIGFLTGTPTHVFYDTEHATLSNMLAYPFATCVHVPRCYRKPIRWRHRRYSGYHELAYLHPEYFTPDSTVLKAVGLGEGETFSVVRFVGWGAAHDIGRHGFSEEGRIEAVKRLNKFGPVFISCEGPLPEGLEQYRLDLPVSRIHDLMAFASLMFGESATMCSEAAVLGVPGVFVDPLGRGYTDEQEELYGLVSNFTPEQEQAAIERGTEILRDYDAGRWQTRRDELLSDMIDVTKMIERVALGQEPDLERVLPYEMSLS